MNCVNSYRLLTLHIQYINIYNHIVPCWQIQLQYSQCHRDPWANGRRGQSWLLPNDLWRAFCGNWVKPRASSSLEYGGKLFISRNTCLLKYLCSVTYFDVSITCVIFLLGMHFSLCGQEMIEIHNLFYYYILFDIIIFTFRMESFYALCMGRF